jgi:hypothetical protein
MNCHWTITSLLLLAAAPATSQNEYYIPKALIMPVHKSSGELHASLGKGGGTDINVSYAITKHLAVFTTATINRGKSTRDGLWGDRYYIRKNDNVYKGGIGYFASPQGKLVHIVESYIGYGRYKVDNYQYFAGETSGSETNASFWNIFWQIQATHEYKTLQLTAGIRITYSKYTLLEYLQDFDADTKVSVPNMRGTTIDPVVSISYLFKHFKVNGQFGFSGFSNSVEVTNGNGSTRYHLFAPIGRLSIQKNFLLHKRN